MKIKPSERYFLQHQDSKLLCDQHKTEYKPPQDIQFEEYGSKHTLPRQPASETKGKKGKSIFTGNKKKKKVWSKPLTSIENEIEWSNAVNFKINHFSCFHFVGLFTNFEIHNRFEGMVFIQLSTQG